MKYLLILSSLLFGFTAPSFAETPTSTGFELAQSVVKTPLAQGVSFKDAAESLTLKANALNLKLVAHQAMSEELKAQGVKDVRHIEIFQFCDVKTAKALLDYEILFAAYLPCRITLLEDKQGKGWLLMLNLDMLLKAASLPPDLHAQALKVRNALHQVIEAGAKGEL
jgi:uncharacterized protein (DUF302 family)